MTPSDFDSLQRWLCQEALGIVGYPDTKEGAAYKAMANEPELLTNWWSGAFEQSEEESVLLDSAARAFAHGEPLPKLSLAQRGRLALRLRLGSRILRALSNRSATPKKGWFPTKLRKMPEPDLLEWLLVDAWPLCAEILDEALLWSDEFEHPPAPSMKRPPQKLSSEDSSSFSV